MERSKYNTINVGPKTLSGLRAGLQMEKSTETYEAAVEAAAEAGSSQNEPIGPASGRLPGRPPIQIFGPHRQENLWAGYFVS